jgi:hypothetical protein
MKEVIKACNAAREAPLVAGFLGIDDSGDKPTTDSEWKAQIEDALLTSFAFGNYDINLKNEIKTNDIAQSFKPSITIAPMPHDYAVVKTGYDAEAAACQEVSPSVVCENTG